MLGQVSPGAVHALGRNREDGAAQADNHGYASSQCSREVGSLRKEGQGG